MTDLKRWLAPLALGAVFGIGAAHGQPSATRQAQAMPDISLRVESPGASAATGRDGEINVVVAGSDADADATQAAADDVGARGISAIVDHEAQLHDVLAHMPDPFVRVTVAGAQLAYLANSFADCLAFAGARAAGGTSHVVCRGNPYASAGFYLGSYYNEIGQPDRAVAALDLGLVAGPNSPILIAERNAALNALQRWDDALAGAARGLAIPDLAPKDRALMLRNRGYALTELKRLDEAQQAYQNSLALDPDNALAKNELTYIAGLKAGAAATPGGIFMPNKPKSP